MHVALNLQSRTQRLFLLVMIQLCNNSGQVVYTPVVKQCNLVLVHGR